MVSQLQRKKQEAGKLKKQSERKYKKASSLKRKSTFGLSSLQRRTESYTGQLADISEALNQRLAQQESILRLKATAEERLGREKELKDQSQQELEFADSTEEKQQINGKINSIMNNINDITSEIKQRNSMAKKLSNFIEDYKKSKSKFSNLIKKQSQSKPTLLKLAKTSQNATDRLKKQFDSRQKREQSIKNNLSRINKLLAEVMAKRRKAKSKRKKLKKVKRKREIKSVRLRPHHPATICKHLFHIAPSNASRTNEAVQV